MGTCGQERCSQATAGQPRSLRLSLGSAVGARGLEAASRWRNESNTTVQFCVEVSIWSRVCKRKATAASLDAPPPLGPGNTVARGVMGWEAQHLMVQFS